jgi:anthranilate synthase/aminodeoxychorismate synthase-like glutamine amidotransferase
MLLIIDNYDSFTFNLYQYLGEITNDIKVVRNDAITLDEIKEMDISHIVISPGPGYPQDAGISKEIISKLGTSIPILGICLGHQAIGEVFGAKVVHAPELFHGKTSKIYHVGNGIFKGCPLPFEGGRYHSLVVQRDTIGKHIAITATTEDGIIMGIKHKDYPIYGAQFHPESILTQEGKRILQNFIVIGGDGNDSGSY